MYNYKTGEILCMVSAPSYDPLNVPKNLEENDRYKGAYLNRFFSSAFVPGSVFKTVTLTAALENLPDAETRTWNCTGSVQIGGRDHHLLRRPRGADTEGGLRPLLQRGLCSDRGGAGGRYPAAVYGEGGAYQRLFRGRPAHRQGHVQLGRHHRRAAGLGRCGPPRSGEPLCLPAVDGAIANGGKAAEPYLIRKTVSSLGIPSLPITQHTGQLIDSRTAATVADFMANNVTETYGTKRFPNMELCAKSGTAEVGTGQTPHAWFAGFLRNEDAPYAFVVLVENGGGGNAVAGTVAGKVLNVIVNGY